MIQWILAADGRLDGTIDGTVDGTVGGTVNGTVDSTKVVPYMDVDLFSMDGATDAYLHARSDMDGTVDDIRNGTMDDTAFKSTSKYIKERLNTLRKYIHIYQKRGK